MEISCIILAGGKSIRLGHDKVIERLGNSTLLEKVISRIDAFSREIIVVTAEKREFEQLSGNPKVTIESDIFPGRGSLGGIYTGLVKSNSFHNLVIAADMPFINRELIAYMIETAEGYDYVIPRMGKFYEPLHAIYSKNCISPIKNMIDRDRRIIIELFDYVKVRYVDTEEIDRFDPEHFSFFNINTKQDLDLARKLESGFKN